MSFFFVGDLSVVKDVRLSSNDKIVYFTLVGYMNHKTGKCYPRYSTIKKDTGISRSSIQRATRQLAKLGYLTIKRLASTNLYLLTQQMVLEKTRIDHVKSQADTSEGSQRDLLIKPLYKTSNRYNKFNSYQRARYSPPTAKHSGTSIEYEGEQYEYCAEFGNYIEYRNKNGDKVAKHKWKKDEPIKKFDAIVKVAS
jgi:hypothetical protein|tara:strand:- start:40 stop:627 length:588 start_codon:yes stop_codon:yes gene_type:complete